MSLMCSLSVVWVPLVWVYFVSLSFLCGLVVLFFVIPFLSYFVYSLCILLSAGDIVDYLLCLVTWLVPILGPSLLVHSNAIP